MCAFFNDKNYEFEKNLLCNFLISFLVRQQSLGDGCACIYVCSVNWVWLKFYYGMNYTLHSQPVYSKWIFTICLPLDYAMVECSYAHVGDTTEKNYFQGSFYCLVGFYLSFSSLCGLNLSLWHFLLIFKVFCIECDP